MRTNADRGLPLIIQGGMGVGVSGWELASAVAKTGQLGVVSGVALHAVLARRLQLGDPGGHLREALGHFPRQDIAARILQRYFVPGGIGPGTPFRPVPQLALRPNPWRDALIAAGNFAHVWLARRGYDGPVGINYLEKIQLATPAAAYGAMLAGVDYVLMGAASRGRSPRCLTRSPRANGQSCRLTSRVPPLDSGTPSPWTRGSLPCPTSRCAGRGSLPSCLPTCSPAT